MKRSYVFILLIFVAVACKKEPKAVLPPEKALLTMPAKNELCTQGVVVSTTISRVTFRWKESANTEKYVLIIKELISGKITTIETAVPVQDVDVQRNMPYSWSVRSISSRSSATAESESWKFYNSGPGTATYAPFPTDLLYPKLGESIIITSGQLTLRWNGSDVDNDIAGYDLYFGNVANPPLFKKDLVKNELIMTGLTKGQTYYWKVIAKDGNGNTSDSGIYQFGIL